MSGADDLVREFLVESYENLDLLDHALVALGEGSPRSREAGEHLPDDPHDQGHVWLPRLHEARVDQPRRREPAVRLRDGELVLDAAMTTGLLAMVDAIRNILASIELTGAEDDVDYRR